VLRPFYEVDVFTDVAYLGNPLVVVMDADGLSDSQMQAVANWANVSETTFVQAPTQPGADYRARIFTPVSELPFAGHPTLGTCHVWLSHHGHQKEAIVQQCEAGLVRVRAGAGRLAFAAPPLTRSGPVDEGHVQHVAALLNIGRDEVVEAQWVSNGPPWVAVLLRDAAAVLALRPGTVDAFVGAVGLYPPGSALAYEVRAFTPKDGATIEDPVTGSLNASLAQWLTATGRAQAPYVAGQGTALGRAGRAYINADDDGSIWVGGNVVTCVTGSIDI
jgi:PhzF family phenazine biosynthesis protein